MLYRQPTINSVVFCFWVEVVVVVGEVVLVSHQGLKYIHYEVHVVLGIINHYNQSKTFWPNK